MRIEVTYYADDGEEFDTEEACREYEERLKKDMSSVIFYDENKKVMKNPTIEDIEQDAFYLKVLNAEEATRLFDWLHYQISFDFVEQEVVKDHFYAWMEDPHLDDGFRDITKRFEDLKNTIDILTKEVAE